MASSFDRARLLRDFERLATVGRNRDGSVTRIALSPEDRQARGILIHLMRDAGLAVRIDRFGNIWGRTGGRWDEPAVVAGSHLDTVPGGGLYDGVVGVVAALEAVRALTASGRPLPLPLGVVNFTAEESTRYGVATIGSKGVAGVLSPEAIEALRDRDGVTFREAVQANAGLEWVGEPQPPGRIGAFLELHVEQGRELEMAGVPVGKVEAVAAPSRFRVIVHGEAAHSGATLLTWRKDGLVAASDLVLALERIAELEEEYGTVATATIFSLHPISINVVPGRVELGVDIRGVDIDSKRRAVRRFLQTVERVSAFRGISIDVEPLSDEEPVRLHPRAIGWVEEGCRRTGARSMTMFSRAGHDAMNMARRWPTALIFIPSRGGISHHPDEYTDPAHIELGARVLMEAMAAAVHDLAERGPDDAHL